MDGQTSRKIIDAYHRHNATIYRVCFVYLKNRTDTEDMVQNTFLKLMEHPKDFESEAHEKAWIITVAGNLCKDFFRKASRRDAPIEAAFTLGTEDPPLDETLQAVFSLPTHYRMALYLFYYEGYSTREIAQIMRKKEGTVRSYLHRGRELLKTILGGDCGE